MKLTEEQKDKAWYYFNHLDNNSDKDIAKLVDATKGSVCVYLAQRLKMKFDKINAR